MQEKSVLQKIKNGDEQAFKIFFKSFYHLLFGYIISLTLDRNQAEDITQQAFINFWSKRSKIDINRSPKSYLFTIAHNLFLDSQRQLKSERNYLQLIQKETLIEDTEEQEKHIEKIEKLRQAINQLPDKCKTILLLNKIEGLKYQEIADRLQISIKTVESQMRIAFSKIREDFKNDKIILWLFFNKHISLSINS